MQDHHFSRKFSLCAMLIVANRHSRAVGSDITFQDSLSMWALCHPNAISQRLAKSARTQHGHCGEFFIKAFTWPEFPGPNSWQSWGCDDVGESKTSDNPATTGWDGNMKTMPCPKDVTLSSLSASVSAPCCPDLYIFYLQNDHITERSPAHLKSGSK